jgi:L-ascorbate metabolism protein UlaG (beta-lactamase superfamily)
VERGVRVTFLGHSTVLVDVGGVRVLTDPILRAGLGPVRRQVDPIAPELLEGIDAVFVSHGHHDHLDLPSMRRIPGRPRVIVPRGLGRLTARTVVGEVEEVVPGDRVTIRNLDIEVVDADHDGRRRPFGPSAIAVGCVIRGSESVYFAGDTDLFPAMADLTGGIDVALLPVWGWGPRLGPGHLDPIRAATAVDILRPRVAVPIHWGTLYPAGFRQLLRGAFDEPGPAFAREAAARAPGLDVRVLAPGETIEVSARGVSVDRQAEPQPATVP